MSTPFRSDRKVPRRVEPEPVRLRRSRPGSGALACRCLRQIGQAVKQWRGKGRRHLRSPRPRRTAAPVTVRHADGPVEVRDPSSIGDGSSTRQTIPRGRRRRSRLSARVGHHGRAEIYARVVSAYVIIETDVLDPEQYERYKAASPESIAAGGGRFVARGGELAVLEGDWHPSRLVVLEFEDVEAAKRWYDSPEYREVRRLRENAATLRVVAVEGLSPG
jgi:uncharacterized protein (DUF1330 family)